MIPVCEPFLGGKEKEYVLDAIETGWISSSGKYIPAFEQAMASYCGVKHGVATTNGTVALHLALVALGVGPGDEVIMPDFNGIFGAFAVCYTGAKPVFVDAEPETWNIDTRKIEGKITARTKAIMPVHIYGHPSYMDDIWRIARKHNLRIIEDAAEVHGAQYRAESGEVRKAGSLGDVSIFSFFANKIATTGEGGMVLTNDDELAEKCRYYKNLCFPPKGMRTYVHEHIGFNYRMSNVLAAIGLAQVEKLEEYVAARRRNHDRYQEAFSGIPGLSLQTEKSWAKNVYWMNGVTIDEQLFGMSRDEILPVLREKKIDFRLFFSPMHQQPSLRKYGCDCTGDYPVSLWLGKNGLYLPSASNLTADNVEYIGLEFRQLHSQGSRHKKGL
jgi:perosamine synthetase